MNGVAQKLKAFSDRRKTERERTAENVEKEDFLLSQIDEFREKARQLQELLTSKEDKVQKLQEIVAEREGKAQELSDMIEERQDAADRVVSGVGMQIEGMIEKVDAKLNELNETFAERLAENAVGSTEQNEEVRTLIKEHNEKLKETITGLEWQFDRIKNEICEKIHTEDVNCYRNMQALIEESDKKLDKIEEEVLSIASSQTKLTIVIIFTVLNFAGIAGIIARMMGLI